MKIRLTRIIVVIWLLALNGCGNIGDLYLPDEKPKNFLQSINIREI